jgi:hypothetical protein
VPPQPPVVEPAYGSMPIIWQSNFKGSHVSIVSGTILNFTWGNSLHSLLRCPPDAFDACALDQCERLAPALYNGNIEFPTELIDSQPVTGGLLWAVALGFAVLLLGARVETEMRDLHTCTQRA